MNRHLPLLFGLFWFNAAAPGQTAADRFDKVKEGLSQAGCTRFQFLSIIESDIFDQIDTVAGDAIISSDGRYLVCLGPDQYLYNLKHLFSYSEENRQVTIEAISPEESFGGEVSFITRLDEFYDTYPIVADLQYRLIKHRSRKESIPDSMIVSIRSDTLTLDRLEYYDVNEELNRIVFMHQETAGACHDSVFTAEYPDSVERIRLD